MREPMREFWALSRNSVSLPWVVFPNGMLPKLVPSPLPGAVLRQTLVRSMNPTGVM
jgi:hypothetical protein